MAPPVQLTPREITRIQTTMHNFDAELRVALASGQFAHIKKVFDAMGNFYVTINQDDAATVAILSVYFSDSVAEILNDMVYGGRMDRLSEVRQASAAYDRRTGRLATTARAGAEQVVDEPDQGQPERRKGAKKNKGKERERVEDDGRRAGGATQRGPAGVIPAGLAPPAYRARDETAGPSRSVLPPPSPMGRADEERRLRLEQIKAPTVPPRTIRAADPLPPRPTPTTPADKTQRLPAQSKSTRPPPMSQTSPESRTTPRLRDIAAAAAHDEAWMDIPFDADVTFDPRAELRKKGAGSRTMGAYEDPCDMCIRAGKPCLKEDKRTACANCAKLKYRCSHAVPREQGRKLGRKRKGNVSDADREEGPSAKKSKHSAAAGRTAKSTQRRVSAGRQEEGVTKVSKGIQVRPAAAESSAAGASAAAENEMTRIQDLERVNRRIEATLEAVLRQGRVEEQLMARLERAEDELARQVNATSAATRWCKSTITKVRQARRYFQHLDRRIDDLEMMALGENEDDEEQGSDDDVDSADPPPAPAVDTEGPVQPAGEDDRLILTADDCAGAATDTAEVIDLTQQTEVMDLTSSPTANSVPLREDEPAAPLPSQGPQDEVTAATVPTSPAAAQSRPATPASPAANISLPAGGSAEIDQQLPAGGAVSTPHHSPSAAVSSATAPSIPVLQITTPTPQSSMEQVVAATLFPPDFTSSSSGPRRSSRSRSVTPNERRYVTRGNATRSADEGTASGSKRKAGKQGGPARKKSREPQN